jgi:hypothetical protein
MSIWAEQVCRPEGAFAALVGSREVGALVPPPGADQKDRHTFALEWLGHASSTGQVMRIHKHIIKSS